MFTSGLLYFKSTFFPIPTNTVSAKNFVVIYFWDVLMMSVDFKVIR